MKPHELPTWDEIAQHTLDELHTARTALANARDWLISDWQPVGSALTDAAGTARIQVLEKIGELKAEIDAAKNLMSEGRNGD